MNRLINKNPTSVEINGVQYNINTDFRICLKIILAYENNELAETEQVGILLYNLYSNKKVMPKEFDNPEVKDKAHKLGIRFLDCNNKYKNLKTEQRSYSFEQDDRFIAAALLNKNNPVDLNNIEYMHLWDFMLHFEEMGESTFSRITQLRRQKQKGKLTKEERLECEHIGWDIINLKENYQIKEEKLEDTFENYLQD